MEKESGGDSSYKHRLSNVNFINMGRLQKIKCVVDNQVSLWTAQKQKPAQIGVASLSLPLLAALSV